MTGVQAHSNNSIFKQLLAVRSENLRKKFNTLKYNFVDIYVLRLIQHKKSRKLRTPLNCVFQHMKLFEKRFGLPSCGSHKKPFAWAVFEIKCKFQRESTHHLPFQQSIHK